MRDPEAWLGLWYMTGLVFRGAVAMVMTLTVVGCPREFIPVERWGYGVASGGAFMSLPVLWASPSPTPFDGWAGTVFAAGVLIAASGRLFRGFRHWHSNYLQTKRGQQ